MKNRRIKKNINGRPRLVCCRPPWSRRTVCCGCGWDLRANRRVETPSVPVSPAAGSQRTPAWIDRPLPKTTATSWALTKRLFLCWECCSRCRFQSYDYITSASWSRFSPPSILLMGMCRQCGSWSVKEMKHSHKQWQNYQCCCYSNCLIKVW